MFNMESGGQPSYLDSKSDLESLIVRIPSSHDLGRFTERIVELFNQYGALIVEFQTDESPRDQLLCFKTLFGTTVNHDRADQDMIAEIAISDKFQGYLGASNEEHPFHTDGAYDDNPPHIIALRCELPAKSGGVSKLVDGAAIYHHLLSRDKKLVDALFRPDALCVARAGKSSSQAVFRNVDGRIFIRYRSDKTTTLSPDPDLQKAMYLIKEFLSNEENSMSFSMKQRQVLITDNTRVLHARTAFAINELRKMHRLFFSGDTASFSGVAFGFRK